ncbi:MAG: hypothetical protein ABR616_05730 [Dermatophilaceae bacterium]
MSKEFPVPRMKQYRLLTTAYVVLALLGAIGFWRVETTADELELESKRRAFVLCELTNDNQQNLVAVLDRMYSPDLSSPVDEETQRARDEFLEDVRETLQPIECPPNPDDVLDGEVEDEGAAAVVCGVTCP